MTVGRHYQEKASTADFFVECLLHMGRFFLLIVYRCLTLLLLLLPSSSNVEGGYNVLRRISSHHQLYCRFTRQSGNEEVGQ